jgi:hypothetical protein
MWQVWTLNAWVGATSRFDTDALLPQQQVRSSAFDVIASIFSKHFRMPRIPCRRIVVEIVDVDSRESHKVQQVRFSKLLNLKVRKKGDPLSPRQLL